MLSWPDAEEIPTHDLLRRSKIKPVRRITVEAYQALRDALAAVTWYKKTFRRLLSTLLRDRPELLVGLDFNEPKRVVADTLVDALVRRESVLQEFTLQLMLEVAAMTSFSDIERLHEPDRSLRLGEAKTAVTRLRTVTERLDSNVRERERIEAEREAKRAHAEALRRFDDDIVALKVRFVSLEEAASPQQRGYAFETLLIDLFKIFDLEPRLAYRTNAEQIDGSLTFDTDDYIIEAKWLSEPVDRAAADAFAAKARRKGKNALGLFVAVNGFSGPAIDTYREGTPFLTMDGTDLFLVLDGRIRLDDLLRAKRRHANETGSCSLPAATVLGGE